LIEIRVFPKKSPKILDVSGNPEIPGKVVFSVFSDDAKIQPISENPRKKFPGKSDFGENFRKSPKIRKNSGNFGKKCQNVDFGKFNPRLQSAF
jgi:hypothetical protein